MIQTFVNETNFDAFNRLINQIIIYFYTVQKNLVNHF